VQIIKAALLLGGATLLALLVLAHFRFSPGALFAEAVRKSVLYGTCFIGCLYILTFFIGFGAIVFVASIPFENITVCIAPSGRRPSAKPVFCLTLCAEMRAAATHPLSPR
jgi:Na+(H+)/acetate symporter ActP